MTSGTIIAIGLGVGSVVAVSSIAGVVAVAVDGDPKNDGNIAVIATISASIIAPLVGLFPVLVSLHKQMNSLKDELVESTRSKADAVGYSRRESEESERAQAVQVDAAHEAGVIQGSDGATGTQPAAVDGRPGNGSGDDIPPHP